MTTVDSAREAARLILRPVRDGDEGPVFTLLSDERVVRYMLFPVFDRDQARDFVARLGRQAPTAGRPHQVVFAIVLKGEGDEPVGLCGLVISPELEAGEAWYLLRPDLWGRGLVTAALRSLVDFGFSELRLHRIWASCLPANPGSARVLEKLGFRREGHLRQNLRIRGAWQDSYLYAVLAGEWSSA